MLRWTFPHDPLLGILPVFSSQSELDTLKNFVFASKGASRGWGVYSHFHKNDDIKQIYPEDFPSI